MTDAAIAPSFTEQLEPIEIKQGDIARFTATIAGVPTPRVMWFREVKALPYVTSYQIYNKMYAALLFITIFF